MIRIVKPEGVMNESSLALQYDDCDTRVCVVEARKQQDRGVVVRPDGIPIVMVPGERVDGKMLAQALEMLGEMTGIDYELETN